MKHLILKFVILALASGLLPAAHGADRPEQSAPSMGAMSVAQLEAAGDAARLQKNYEEAIRYFKAAVRKDPRNSVLYNKLGLAELKSECRRAALINFRKAAKYNRKFADAVNNVGAVEYMDKNYAAAARYFKQAVVLEEKRATFHVNLGAAFFAQKKMEPAAAEYAKALQIDPEVLQNESRAAMSAQISTPEERAQYSFMLAKIYAEQGNTEECLHCLRMAKEQGYRNLKDVYKESAFSGVRSDARLADIVAPPGHH